MAVFTRNLLSARGAILSMRQQIVAFEFIRVLPIIQIEEIEVTIIINNNNMHNSENNEDRTVSYNSTALLETLGKIHNQMQQQTQTHTLSQHTPIIHEHIINSIINILC